MNECYLYLDDSIHLTVVIGQHALMCELQESNKISWEKEKVSLNLLIHDKDVSLSMLQTELSARIPVDVEQLAVKLGLSQSFEQL